MNHDDARRLLSDRLDGELPSSRDPELDQHLAACPACRAHLHHLEGLRERLRAAPAPEPEDLTERIMAAVRHEREPSTSATGAAPAHVTPVAAGTHPARRRDLARRLLPAAAVFVVAAVTGALLVGTFDRSEDGGVAAADLPQRITAAQSEVVALRAAVEVEERGGHPDVPERSFRGALAYEAPETLSLTLDDETTYPSASWPADDLQLEVDDGSWWVRGLRGCPVVAQPACLSAEPETRAVTDREPFSAATPVPLDLITPVQSFSLAGEPVTLPAKEVDGRPTVGVEVTAAQVEPLLAGFHAAGALRQVHPSDPVELRLDEQTLVPVEVVVRAGDGEQRRRWAAAHGYDDDPGAEILTVRLHDLAVESASEGDDPVPASPVPPAPEGSSSQSAGFTDGPAPMAAEPTTAALGALVPHRAGSLRTPGGPPVDVRTYADGRAWASVRATEQWDGPRLFGDLGEVVRTVPLGGDAGVGYLSQDGTSIGLHAEGIDLVVTGSVAREDLVALASSLGVTGHVVPPDWEEAAVSTEAEARSALPGLLLPGALDGFDAPAFRVDEVAGGQGGSTVTSSFAGPGDRSFVIVQAPGDRLTPPLDTADVVAVDVRGTTGRFSPLRGQLEWVEAGSVVTVTSESLGLDELVALAEGLRSGEAS